MKMIENDSYLFVYKRMYVQDYKTEMYNECIGMHEG